MDVDLTADKGVDIKDVAADRGAEVTPERHDSTLSDGRSRPTTGESAPAPSGGVHADDEQLREVQERNKLAFQHNIHTLPVLDTTIALPPSVQASPHHYHPASAALHLQTNVPSSALVGGFAAHAPVVLRQTPILYETPVSTDAIMHQSLMSPASQLVYDPTLSSNLSVSSLGSNLSPGSALPSPYLAALADLTPLPSPLVLSQADMPPWRRVSGPPTRSRQSSLEGRSSLSSASPPKRKKGYSSLMQETSIANASATQEHGPKSETKHARNRSISDFVPEALTNHRPRHVTIGPGDVANLEAQDYHMHREAFLAAQRGLNVPLTGLSSQVPTPPASTSSIGESDDADEAEPHLEDGSATEYLEIHCGIHNKRRKFRQLRQLGLGTFSKVMLATRERIPAHITPEIEDSLDPHKLVAVKIVEHGPAGGADEERIETSLKREVEMLKCVSHPSLVHLKACEYQERRALLVLTYCPGGDLFDLANQNRDVLTPAMLQRMFAELVSAVRYLHAKWIVHRDIKLENVLVNLRAAQLLAIEDPRTHPTPLVTLTDLGLSRRLPQPPEPVFLTTRCGSEDYAAPEILLGQPYDGRLTDAWALGVLLYALMEGRLPFDAPPGKPDRSRNTHRIARCDWIWCRFGDEHGEWDAARGVGFEDARKVAEGLLKKVRMGRKSLEEIEKLEWVREGIRVPGGLQTKVEDGEDELL